MTPPTAHGANRVVAFNWELSDSEIERIGAVIPELTVVARASRGMQGERTAWDRRLGPEDLSVLVRDAEILVALSMVSREVFDAADTLKFVSSLEHGVNWLPFDLLAERGVVVANCRGARDAVTAEQAFALLLACAKHLVDDCIAVREARYQENWVAGHMGTRLEGETLAIIGLGGIGRAIAKRAAAFDMKVIGVRRRPHSVECVEEVVGPESLFDVLGRARFVILIAPLTPATLRLMNERSLRAMRPDAYLINMSRGGLVDERAVYRALTEGWIAGYASDAWWDYGPAHFGVPSRFDVHRLPNVIGTGGRSINVPDDWPRVFEMGLANVRAYLDGRPLTRRVDLSAGY